MSGYLAACTPCPLAGKACSKKYNMKYNGSSALLQEDREDIRSSIADMQASRSEREALLLRRAMMAEASPVLTIDLPAALRAAFATAAQRHSEAKLVEVGPF